MARGVGPAKAGLYWSATPPVSGGLVPSCVKKMVPCADDEKPRWPLQPAPTGTADE